MKELVIVLVMNLMIIRLHGENCSEPLGMEDGRILDSQISASSSYQENLVGPDKELFTAYSLL